MRREVSFAGSMRRNLIAMLDALEVHTHLGITSTAELFGASCDRIATTSALRFPVFRRGKNYSGNSAIVTEPLFIEMLEVLLGPLLAAMPAALVIPLGKWASAGVLHVADQGVIDGGRVHQDFLILQARTVIENRTSSKTLSRCDASSRHGSSNVTRGPRTRSSDIRTTKSETRGLRPDLKDHSLFAGRRERSNSTNTYEWRCARETSPAIVI